MWVCECVFTQNKVNFRGIDSSVRACFRRKDSVSLWRLKAALTRSWLLEQELSVMTHRPKTFMCALLDQPLSRFMRCQMSCVLWGISYSLYQKWSDWNSFSFNKVEDLGGGILNKSLSLIVLQCTDRVCVFHIERKHVPWQQVVSFTVLLHGAHSLDLYIHSFTVSHCSEIAF